MGKKPQAPVQPKVEKAVIPEDTVTTPVVPGESPTTTDPVGPVDPTPTDSSTQPQTPVQPKVEKGSGEITLKEAVYFKGKKHEKGDTLKVTAEEKATLLPDWYE